MLGCPDCGSLISYQHTPGCKLAVMENKTNLMTRYKDEFLRGWQGCSHLECLPECSHGYCQRLADALKRWEDSI